VNRRTLLTTALFAFGAGRLPLPEWTRAARAAEESASGPAWRHGISLFGDLKYPPGFKQFDYVNPQAPKGGVARQIAVGTYDNFNIAVAGVKGALATGIDFIYDTLLVSALDEVSSEYGLLAEAVRFPDDFSSVTYRLRAEAKWHDGKPMTPEDVIFSFQAFKKYSPQLAAYYRHVVKAEKAGERDVVFTFDSPGNRELPQIVGQILVLPKHWWEGTADNGSKRDIGATTLEAPLGSGPYRIKDFSPGRNIVYQRVTGYWGEKLNINVGRDNFDQLRFEYFRDTTVALEAFKADTVDWRTENSAKNWATAYDFPAVNDKRVIREEFPINNIGVMQAFAFNIRRAKFQDPRVRQAFNFAFDFEEMNKQISSVSTNALPATSRVPSLLAADCRQAASSKSSKPSGTKYRPSCSPPSTQTPSAATRKRCAEICGKRCGCSARPAMKCATNGWSTARPASLIPSNSWPRIRASNACFYSTSRRLTGSASR